MGSETVQDYTVVKVLEIKSVGRQMYVRGDVSRMDKVTV